MHGLNENNYKAFSELLTMPVSRSPQQKKPPKPAMTLSLNDGSEGSAEDAPSQGMQSRRHRSRRADSNLDSPGSVAAAIQALPIDAGIAVSPTVSLTSDHPKSTSYCKGGPGNRTCNLEVKKNQLGVECDLCLYWYHCQCQEISRSAYNALDKHDSVSFICSMCRQLPDLAKLRPKTEQKDAATQCSLNPDPGHTHSPSPSTKTETAIQTNAPSVSEEQNTLSGLIGKVSALEATLKEHMLSISSFYKTSDQNTTQDATLVGAAFQNRSYAEVVSGNQHQVRPSPPSTMHATTSQNHSSTRAPASRDQTQDYRTMVREELLELEERKKRRSSVVIRGLGAGSVNEASAKFAEITEALIGEKVVLAETCRIPSNGDLYRGNIHNQRQRQLILESAKNLKDSPFPHVYIKKDLTYMQRMQLQARYKQRQAQPTSVHRPPTNDPPRESATASLPDGAVARTDGPAVQSLERPASETPPNPSPGGEVQVMEPPAPGSSPDPSPGAEARGALEERQDQHSPAESTQERPDHLQGNEPGSEAPVPEQPSAVSLAPNADSPQLVDTSSGN